MGSLKAGFTAGFVRVLVAAMALQSTVAPVALATPSVQQTATALRDTAARELANGETQGWRYYDAQQREIRAIEVPASILSTGEYKALSPILDDLGTRVGFRATLRSAGADGMTVRLEVLDRNFARSISARLIRIQTGASAAEENVLRFRRALRSMTDEVQARRGQLAALGTSDRLQRALGNLLIPSAHAGNMLTSSLTHVSLVLVAAGAGVLVFGSRWIENTRVRVTTGIAALVVGAITYVVGNYFGHDGLEGTPMAPSPVETPVRP